MKINGIKVPVERNSPTLTPFNIGYSERSFAGGKRGVINGTKRDGSLRTSFLEKREGNALYAILEGRGDYWSFDDILWSSKGEKADIDTYSFESGKFGDAVSVDSTLTLSPYDEISEGLYSVSFWQRESVSWDHFVLQSDDEDYKNGVLFDRPDWVSVSTENNEVVFDTGANIVDEVFIIPELVTSKIVLELYNLENQFLDYPKLRIEDDFFGFDGSKICETQVTDVDYEGPVDTGLIIEFDIEEV